MFAAGIVDPLKVERSALENAASIAGLLLTTEALIVDMPEKNCSPFVHFVCRLSGIRHYWLGKAKAQRI
jgi:hypothetical protein